MRRFLKTTTFILSLIVLLNVFPTTISAQPHLDEEVMDLVTTPIAVIFNGGSIQTHSLTDFVDMTYDEVKAVIEQDIDDIIEMQQSGMEVYWNPDFLELMRTEYPRQYSIVTTLINTLEQIELEDGLVPMVAEGSRNIEDEVLYYSGSWVLHSMSRFTASWEATGNVYISNYSYAPFSDSTPAFCNPVRHNDGTTSAYIVFYYTFTSDAIMTGSCAYTIKYKPSAGGSYTRDVLYSN